MTIMTSLLQVDDNGNNNDNDGEEIVANPCSKPMATALDLTELLSNQIFPQLSSADDDDDDDGGGDDGGDDDDVDKDDDDDGGGGEPLHCLV